MDLKSQYPTLTKLSQLASADKHSILIEGPAGCGKSFFAKKYADMLGVDDFVNVSPTVNNIRESLNYGYITKDKIVFCIENLDSGVLAASYALLKFLEEPTLNVYIVVTCRNRYKIPDTILSRSVIVSAPSVAKSDMDEFAQIRYPTIYNSIKDTDLWYAVKTLNDVSYVCSLSDEKRSYIVGLKDSINFKDNISSLSWKLSHFPDNSEIDVEFLVNFVIVTARSDRIKRYGIKCLEDLSNTSVAKYATFSKFLFECKYGE